MALKLRPTGLGAGIDKDRPEYTVYCGGWAAHPAPRAGPFFSTVQVTDAQRELHFHIALSFLSFFKAHFGPLSY